MKFNFFPAVFFYVVYESDPTVYEYCWYGDDYDDEHCRDFADGSWGCLKRRKTIEKDLELDFILRHPEYKKETEV